MVLKRGAGRLQIKPSGPGDENGYNHLSFMAKPGWLVLSRSGFCTYGTDHMETVQAVYFCFGVKPANSNFATKTAKKKMWILSFFIAKLPEKAKKTEFLLRFQRWMKKTNIFRARSGLIWCRKWNGHRRKPWGQRRFYQPTENFYTTLRSPSKRISVKRSITFFHLSSSKHRIHQQVHIPNILW